MEQYAAVIDDNKEDRDTVMRAFPRGKLSKCEAFDSGQDFHDKFLRTLRGKKYAQMPAILFLDIRMESKTAGFDLLREMRRRKLLRRVPVIIVSGSDSDGDIETAYRLGANLYISKGEKPKQFYKVIKHILDAITKGAKTPADISEYLETVRRH
jgi:two-component system response regulator